MDGIAKIHEFVASNNVVCPEIAIQIISLGTTSTERTILTIMVRMWKRIGVCIALPCETVIELCLPHIEGRGSIRNLGKITQRKRAEVLVGFKSMAISDLIVFEGDHIGPGPKLKAFIGL